MSQKTHTYVTHQPDMFKIQSTYCLIQLYGATIYTQAVGNYPLHTQPEYCLVYCNIYTQPKILPAGPQALRMSSGFFTTGS